MTKILLKRCEELVGVTNRNCFATFDQWDSATGATRPLGMGTTFGAAVTDLIKQTEECEHDCAYYCTGCDRWFHDIKDEEGMDDHYELTSAIHTDAGNHYCHIDCFRDNQ